jgi:hypothetical protein
MADIYTITLSDGVTTFNVYPLESNGPNNVSIPRKIQVTNLGASFELVGDLTYRFVAGQVFTVENSGGVGSPALPNNGTYTVAGSGSPLVGSTYNAGTNRTTIPVVETGQIGSTSLPLGQIKYSIPTAEEATSLLIPGRGYLNYGIAMLESSVHMLENFAGTAAPSNPLDGQLWYDKNTSPAQLKVYEAAGSPIGWISASDQYVLKSGDTMTGTLVLPQENDAVTPTLSFGDGDTGFYESTDDNLVITTAGGARWLFSGNTLSGIASDSAMILSVTTSSTTPTILPSNSDGDTGIGSNAADELSLIAGATEGIRVTTTDVTVNHTLDMATNTIQNVIDPVNQQDAATKQYVDDSKTSLDVKASVRLTTTGPLSPTYGYTDVGSTIGKTLTGNDGGLLQLDGINPVASDRVLIKDEVGGNATHNGIYVVTTAGVDPIVEITTVTTVADSLGSPPVSLEGKYFTLDTPTDGYYVWYTTGGSPSSDPLVGNRTGIQVTYTVSDTADTIASLTQAAVDGFVLGSPGISQFTATLSQTDTITITNDVVGIAPDSVDGGGSPSEQTGFTISTTQQGTDGTQYVLTRATDADENAEVTPGQIVLVEEGSQHADSGWILTSDNGINVYRNTTATVFDYENVLRSVNLNETRFTGQRRVENLVDSSEDLTTGSWVAATGGVIDDFNTVSFVSANSDGAHIPYIPSDGTANKSFVISAVLWVDSGTELCRLKNTQGGILDTYTSDLTITTTPQRFSISVTNGSSAGSGVQFFGVANKAAGGTGTVHITNIQAQDKTGASDPTVPDRYVSTGVGLGEELVTNGTFDSDTTGWTGSNATLSVVSNALRLTADANGSMFATQSFTTIIGKPYVLQLDCVADIATGSPSVYIGTTTFGGQILNQGITAGNSYSFTFIPTTTTSHVTVLVGAATLLGETADFDNISIKHADHGVGVDGVRVFDTTNGNIVTDNVVTEHTGLLLDFTREATNSCLWNRDLNNVVWSDGGIPTTSQDQIGVDGKANTAWTLTDNEVGDFSAKAQAITIPNDSNTIAGHLYVLKDSDTTRFPEIQLKLSGGTIQNVLVQLNTQTGALSTRSSVGTVTTNSELVSIGGQLWWKVTLTVTNNSTGNNTAQLVTYPAVTTTWRTTEVAATGSCVIDAPQLELNQSTTEGIIFTTDKAGSRIPNTGVLIEDQSTNKCTNYNANPNSGAVAMGTLAAFNAVVTNVVALNGDGSTLFGVVDDSTELAAAGLDALCIDGLVLKIDNSSGAVRANFSFGGATNANAHTISIQTRGDGSIHLSGRYATSNQLFSSVGYEEVEHTDTSTGVEMAISVEVGDVGYFILNQLEEGSTATSKIITEGSAATRNEDVSYATPLNVDTSELHYIQFGGRAIFPDYELQVGTGGLGSPTLTVSYTTPFDFSTAPSGKATVQVFVNGIKQVEGTNKAYIAIAPNTITFNADATSIPDIGDDVEFYGFG